MTEIHADLHSHTTCSDGVLLPHSLVEKAARVGLKALSITDHDNMDAHRLFAREGIGEEIKIIPGIELSCYEHGRDIHILGYYLDANNERLMSYEVTFREDRERRAREIVDKLNHLHIKISYDEVVDQAAGAMIGRPHIAAVLVRRGVVPNIQKAFDHYLDSSKPAYAPRSPFSVRDGVQLIQQAGGVAVVAHPGRTFTDPRLFIALVSSGIDGIEVFHPSHWNVTREYYRTLAHQHRLVITGGSDFHGTRDYDENNFSKFGVTEELFDALHIRSLQRQLHGR
ncbi:MAG: PHP domain-containing protein [Ignavibacteriae bacterium]|nr:MAG: PHP domain-containing protein [Ignavibacteriota bacterium]